MNKKFKIKYQILLITLLPVFLIESTLTYFHINKSIDQAEQLLKSKGQIIAKQIASASEFSIFSGQYKQIQYLLDSSINTHGIIATSAHTADGKKIAQANNDEFSDFEISDYFYFRQEIQSKNVELSDVFETNQENIAASQKLGWINLYISKQDLNMSITHIFQDAAIIFIIGLIFAVLLTSFISQGITHPIYTLLTHLKKVETGTLGQSIDVIENNEIGELQTSFNSMTQALQSSRLKLDNKINQATHELRQAVSRLEYKNTELEQARDQAQNANETKTRFLANMSHEIRTPINGIQGFIKMLDRSELNSTQKRYSQIILKSTNDLTKIINGILDYSKIESGKLQIIFEPFDLYELVEQTRDALFAKVLENKIDIHLIIYSDTPRYLIGDKQHIKQVMINLIGNAIKFTESGFISITVYAEYQNANHTEIVIIIEDTGIGISSNDQANLFQAFTQVETSASRRYTGTGLGLVISKNLISLMEGTINMESEPNVGSKFTVTLPVEIDESGRNEIFEPNYSENIAFIFCARKRCLQEVQSLYDRAGITTEAMLSTENTTAGKIKSQIKQNLSLITMVIFDLRYFTVNIEEIIDDEIRQAIRIIVMHYDPNLLDIHLINQYEFISIINTSYSIRNLLNRKSDGKKSGTRSKSVELVAPKESHILVVDDNEINLNLATELIKLWGHKITEATSAEQAIEHFKKSNFDLIFLDIQMPVIDGEKLMQMIRAKYPKLAAPIIAMTANVVEQERNRLLKSGFDFFIEKPIDEDKLRDLIDHSQPIHKTAPTEIKNELSIDYQESLRLSANEESLVQKLFSMMLNDIPGYKKNLSQAFKKKDQKELFNRIHELHGVVCYTGMPRLKKQVQAVEKCLNMNAEIQPQSITDIINELSRIAEQLPQFIHQKG